MIWICLTLVVVAFGLALPLCHYLIHAGRRWGQMDAPDAPGSGGRKNHATAIPNTGGIAIFAGVALPMAGVLLAVWLVPETIWGRLGFLEQLQDHLAGLKTQSLAGLGVLAALTVMHVLGLVDDRKRLGPFLKLGVQLGVALFLAIVCDVRALRLLEGTWGTPGLVASVALTVIWMVVITNAINFLDNMDGLSGGVAAIIAALFLGANLVNGQWFIAALAALLLGSLIAFLVFNFPPAKVFMGDGGSLVVGLLLSIISIRTTYLTGEGDVVQLHALLTPLVILAVPLYDFTSVTLIRLSQGRSPFVGDHSHFSHRLVKKGLTRKTAVLVIWLCTLATGLSGVMLGSLTPVQAMMAGGQTLAILAVLAMLERSTPAA